MLNRKILILLFATFFSLQCVETLISVRVFPSGEYLMKLRSEGDEKDARAAGAAADAHTIFY